MLYLKEEKIKIPSRNRYGCEMAILHWLKLHPHPHHYHHYLDWCVLGARKMMDIPENKDAEIAEVELDLLRCGMILLWRVNCYNQGGINNKYIK